MGEKPCCCGVTLWLKISVNVIRYPSLSIPYMIPYPPVGSSGMVDYYSTVIFWEFGFTHYQILIRVATCCGDIWGFMAPDGTHGMVFLSAHCLPHSQAPPSFPSACDKNLGGACELLLAENDQNHLVCR